MSNSHKVIKFRLGAIEFGAMVSQVASIERLPEVTGVPETAPYIKGVTNLRGAVMPVIDLRQRLNLPAPALPVDARMLVVFAGPRQVGLLVDSAHDVIDVSDQEIERDSVEMSGIRADYLEGVAKVQGGLLVLLRLGEIAMADANADLVSGGDVFI
ncbi:MAG: chemotaxis protein CheW [Firmicutes bacterium]|nr:chemotaxis protein CheW [Bacillota bacterium]